MQVGTGVPIAVIGLVVGVIMGLPGSPATPTIPEVVVVGTAVSSVAIGSPDTDLVRTQKVGVIQRVSLLLDS